MDKTTTRTRRYKHLPGVVGWKEHPDGPWYVGPDDGTLCTAWGYMIRRQPNRGWNSAYWKVNMFKPDLFTFESSGNMDTAMREIQNRATAPKEIQREMDRGISCPEHGVRDWSDCRECFPRKGKNYETNP